MQTIESAVIDSSFLVALHNKGDSNHRRIVEWLARTHLIRAVMPVVVLTEVAYLSSRESGYGKIAVVLEAIIVSDIQLYVTDKADLLQVNKIMHQYADARLDFVDCCIMALAQRLNITRICTLDRRDFSLVQPGHAAHFELLP